MSSRKRREEIKRLRNPDLNLSEKERRRLKNIKLLHSKLFSEESDSFYDSYADAEDRAAGKNPMNLEYQEKVNAKRKALEVSALDSSGLKVDDSSWHRCVEEIDALKKGEKTKYTDLTVFSN